MAKFIDNSINQGVAYILTGNFYKNYGLHFQIYSNEGIDYVFSGYARTKFYARGKEKNDMVYSLYPIFLCDVFRGKQDS